jgi:hypothetical protein
MQQLRPGVYPGPQGYRFVEKDGVEFEDSDVNKLINRVWGYRRRNHLPEGDPFAEVHAQICTRYPGACQEVVELTRQPVPEDKVFLGKVSARAADWLDARNKKKLKFVSRAESDNRADKCTNCPHLVDYSGCEGCKKLLAEFLTATVVPDVLHERMMGKACRLSCEDLSVGVKLDGQKFLQEAPSHCWRNPVDL